MQTIETLEEKDLKGKRVILRVGFDVPVENGRVINDFRVREALPTIEYLTSRGARVVMLSHIGRKKEETLLPVFHALQKYMKISFVSQLLGSTVLERISALLDGEVLLLENLRSVEEESSNDEVFAKTLASYGDLYVNEAFSVAHRPHASIVVHAPRDDSRSAREQVSNPGIPAMLKRARFRHDAFYAIKALREA